MTNRAQYPGKTLYELLNAAPASAKNQLNGYCHDSAGNLVLNAACPSGSFTPTYTYDVENRLTSTAGYLYVYDGDGKRVKKCSDSSCSSAGTRTLYWTGTGSDALGESNWSGTFNEEYVFFNGKRVARRDISTGAVHYYFSDHLGSASVITDNLGNIQKEADYYPYGGEIVVNGSDINNYKFTGKERDTESGLDDFEARFYSSAIGRFMQPDDFTGGPVDVFDPSPSISGPLPYADIFDPQSLNKYPYVYNNPLHYVDPNGHDAWDIIKGAANAFGSDFFGGAGRQDSGNGDYKVGQAIGDFGATVVGTGEVILGAGGEVGGVALDATGGGAVAGVPAGVISTAAIVQGGTGAATGFTHLLKSANDTSGSKPFEDTPENQDRMSQGKAPVGKDGKPVELHHEGQSANGQVKEMTRTEHRGGENFQKNHPNTGQEPSRIDRNKFKQQRQQYWKNKVKK